MLIRTDVGLVHHIFRFGIRPQNGSYNAMDPLIVPAHEDLVEGGIPAANKGDDLLISEPAPGREMERNMTRLSSSTFLLVESQQTDRRCTVFLIFSATERGWTALYLCKASQSGG